MIKNMQRQGLALAEISAHLRYRRTRLELPPLTAGVPYQGIKDITVIVKAGLSPWRVNRIVAALGDFALRVGRE